MARFRKSGYIFVTFVGDHSPRHVHVFGDGKRMVKWDLDNWLPMMGEVSGKLLRVLEELREEGQL